MTARTDRPVPDLKRFGSAWLRETFPELATPSDGMLLVRIDEKLDPTLVRTVLDAHGFFVRVGEIPGRTTPNQIHGTLDFDVFGLTDATTGDLARRIDMKFITGRHRIASGASIDTVFSQMSPHAVPWADASVRRYYSSFAVTARR